MTSGRLQGRVFVEIQLSKKEAARKSGNDETTDLLHFPPENGESSVALSTCGFTERSGLIMSLLL